MDFDFTGMTNEELLELYSRLETEIGTRQSLERFNDEIAEVVRKARSGGVIEERGNGEAWVQPTGYHNAYIEGDIVTHNGKEWYSLYTRNDQEPGVRGWLELLEDNEDGSPNYPVWQMPQGYEEAYEPGAIVWYPDEDGELYENVHSAGNSWEPGVPGGQWEPYTPDDDAS